MIFGDNKYHNHALHAWLDEHRPGWRVEVKKRPAGSQGFTPLEKRWVVERTNAWNGRCRRHSKDYERRPGIQWGHDPDQQYPPDATPPGTHPATEIQLCHHRLKTPAKNANQFSDSFLVRVDDPATVIVAATDALGRTGSLGVNALIDLLEGKDPKSRIFAARAFARLPDRAKPAITALLRAMDDEDPDVRYHATSAIRQLLRYDEMGTLAKSVVHFLSSS